MATISDDGQWVISETAKSPEEALAKARAWRDAAIIDGWSISETYKTQPLHQYCTLEKDGWKALVVTVDGRDKLTENQKRRGFSGIQADISVWAPDKLHVHVDGVYSMEQLERQRRHCDICEAVDVDTTRYSFAGRCCMTCRKGPAQQHEQGNWTA